MIAGDPGSLAVVPRFVEYSGHEMHRFTEPTPAPSSVDIIVVFVEDWEIECCGTAPVVGDDATWTLTFVETNSDRGRALPAGARWNRDSKIATAGGVEAYWPNPENSRTVSARGYFSATCHGGIVPGGISPTTGHVLGLYLEGMEYRRTVGMWQPVPGTRILRRTHRSPTWFTRDLDTTGRIETGVLMEVAVPRRWATDSQRSG
ncbi:MULTISPECIES: DUF6578 domain-containing protein [unclassified Rhodococcus (in: high G+C Gram-positive bacteria)]|uniref:DUF6578 domain-containing protein n=1 Tax=unclassified Rhodococcus (in: high G+C Gram-positive bacteria) TaxID=192944 RepID=UPI000A80B679|nr:DUF6578 domain-containing protein [Rhodococcus sp. M8]